MRDDRVPAEVPVSGLGWWAISGDALFAALHRAHSGEDPGLLYAELYANTTEENR